MKYTIIKSHANGNEFLLIDEEVTPIVNDTCRVKLAKLLTDKKNGIGSDGLVFFQFSKKYDGKMRMFNPNGSEAEMCGNGLRCLGRYAIEKRNKNKIYIETNKGFEKITKKKLGKNNLYEILFKNISSIKELTFNEIKFSKISVPNPHIVTIVDNFNLLEAIGSNANSDLEHFPEGINVNFVKKISHNLLYIRTYERGAGITLSCGSGNSASSLILCEQNLCDWNKDISIFNDGGIIKCNARKSKDNKYSVAISGSVTYIFKTDIQIDMKNNISQSNIHTYIDEIEAYNKSLEYKNRLIKEYNI